MTFVVLLISATWAQLGRSLEVCDGNSCSKTFFDCNRSCEGEAANFELPFTWKQEGDCDERGPLNKTAIRLDFDLWCLYPGLQVCTDRTCRSRIMDCRNMNAWQSPAFSGTRGCRQRQLIAPDSLQMGILCQWACKVGRPTARCILDFARPFAGQAELIRDFETCYFNETCVGERASNVTVMCKKQSLPPHLPSQWSSDSQVSVLGQFSFLTQTAGFFSLENENMIWALRAGIASTLLGAGVTVANIRILDMLPSGRLASARGLQSGVSVSYAITVPLSIVATVRNIVTFTKEETLSTAINHELAIAGIRAVVTVTRIGSTSVRLADTGVIHVLTAKLAAVNSMNDMVSTQLAAALADLSFTGGALRLYNLTAMEIDSANRARFAVEHKVAELVNQHALTMMTLNATSLKYQNALNNLLQAKAQEMMSAQRVQEVADSLSSAQQVLFDAGVENTTTLMALNEELAKFPPDQAKLSAAETARNTSQATLNAAIANHDQIRSEFAAVTAIHDTDVTISGEAQMSFSSTSAHLDLLMDILRTESSQISDAEGALDAIGLELWGYESSKSATLTELRSTKLNLEDTLRELYQQEVALNATRDSLAAEQARLQEARNDLDNERKGAARIGFLVAVSVLAFLVCWLCFCLGCLYIRNRRLVLRNRVTEFRAPPESTLIVVGRPVDREQVPSHEEPHSNVKEGGV